MFGDKINYVYVTDENSLQEMRNVLENTEYAVFKVSDRQIICYSSVQIRAQITHVIKNLGVGVSKFFDVAESSNCVVVI